MSSIAMPRVLMIDNYDSFTFNLVQYLQTLGAEVITKRNDATTLAEAEALEPTHLVLSPGPGRPEEAGITMPMIERFLGRLPMLGVCLGHQAIAAAFGAPVRHAHKLMHGKASRIEHDGTGLFHGIASPCVVGRYHSLAIRESELPGDFVPAARTLDDGELMAFRHRRLPVHAVQFHPESVLTPEGFQMLGNFLGVRAEAIEFTPVDGLAAVPIAG